MQQLERSQRKALPDQISFWERISQREASWSAVILDSSWTVKLALNQIKNERICKLEIRFSFVFIFFLRTQSLDLSKSQRILPFHF